MGYPLLLFDLDGTIIDTNMNQEESCKYRETHFLVEEFTGKEIADVIFRPFYAAFNSKAVDLMTPEATTLLGSMIEQYFGVPVNVSILLSRRIEERELSYISRVRFIKGNQQWFEDLPDDIKESAYIVTNSPRQTINLLNQNKNIRPENKPLEDFFAQRVVTSDDVLLAKPNPALYDLALSLARHSVDDFLYCGIAFEDSWTGITSALQASYQQKNLYVVGVESSATAEELRSWGAHYTAPALSDINLEILFGDVRRA